MLEHTTKTDGNGDVPEIRDQSNEPSVDGEQSGERAESCDKDNEIEAPGPDKSRKPLPPVLSSVAVDEVDSEGDDRTPMRESAPMELSAG